MSSQPDIETFMRDVSQPGAEWSLSTKERICNGFIAHKQTGEHLETCLDFDRAAYLKALRNKHMVIAWLVIDESATPWGRCVLMEIEISNFKNQVWRRYEDQDMPDPAWSKLRENIFFAFHYSQEITKPYSVKIDMPYSANQIRNIVKLAGRYI